MRSTVWRRQEIDPAEHPSYDPNTDTFVMGRGDETPDFAQSAGTRMSRANASKASKTPADRSKRSTRRSHKSAA